MLCDFRTWLAFAKELVTGELQVCSDIDSRAKRLFFNGPP